MTGRRDMNKLSDFEKISNPLSNGKMLSNTIRVIGNFV